MYIIHLYYILFFILINYVYIWNIAKNRYIFIKTLFNTHKCEERCILNKKRCVFSHTIVKLKLIFPVDILMYK